MTSSRTEIPRREAWKAAVAALMAAAPALPANPVDLLKRHRYEAAAALWEADTRKSPADEKGLRALKGLSLAYHQLGSLYAQFHKFSGILLEEYYEGVLGEASSPLAQYYLAQLQFADGRYSQAAAALEKARKSGAAQLPDPHEVFAAFAAARAKKAADPSPQAKSNAAQWQALDLAGAQPAALPAGLKPESPRARRCHLSILARSPAPRFDETRQALQAVLRDSQNPEMSQDPGKNSQIDFYDPFLMETLSRAYLALAKWAQMRLIEEEKKFPDLAKRFFTHRGLAETCLLLGEYPAALEFLGSQDESPEAKILRAKILGKMGKADEARSLLDGVAKGTKNPVLIRDVAESYYFLGIDLEKGLQFAGQALRDRDGPNFYRTRAGLLLATGKAESALQEYGKGYKIEFRNRIDQIDPEYMALYSLALFLTTKLRYEEIVETLYHLQKEFPACRQMHYAMQGISAGLARSYEAQRIFRKGG